MRIVLLILVVPFLQECSFSTTKEQAIRHIEEVETLNPSEIDTIYDNRNACEGLYFRHFKKIDKDKYIEIRWSKKTMKENDTSTDEIFVGEVLFIDSHLESIIVEFTRNPFTLKSYPQKSFGPLTLRNKIKTPDSSIYVYKMAEQEDNLGKVEGIICIDEKVGSFFTKAVFEKYPYYNEENTTFICGNNSKNKYITNLLSKVK